MKIRFHCTKYHSTLSISDGMGIQISETLVLAGTRSLTKVGSIFKKLVKIIFLPFWQTFFWFWRLQIGWLSCSRQPIRSLQNQKSSLNKAKIWFGEFFENSILFDIFFLYIFAAICLHLKSMKKLATPATANNKPVSVKRYVLLYYALNS